MREINAGIYAFEVPSLLPCWRGLKPQNAQGEYYLTDVIGLLRAAGHVGARAQGLRRPREALGVNTIAELAPRPRLLRERVPGLR